VLAESMVGIAFSQLVNPGAPAVLGAFVSTIDMQSGAPTFGTPETALVMYAVAALARRLDVPFRTGGHLCASKIADAQAAYESSAVMQPTMLAGTNFVLHAAGWLEGGLTMGYEKFVLDADQLGAYGKIADGLDLSENGQGMSAFRENEPGVHFLGTQHTLDNFETAFWKSSLADANSYEQWMEEGSKDANTRATARWQSMLAEYEQPPLDDAISAELAEFVTRRKADLPKSEY
jgi:trimethylamine--corrinoid protein Co-methyltransferase